MNTYIKGKLEQSQSESNLKNPRNKRLNKTTKHPKKSIVLRKDDVTSKVGDLHSLSPRREESSFMSSNRKSSNIYNLPPEQIKYLRKARKVKELQNQSIESLIQRENAMNDTLSQKHYILKSESRSRTEEQHPRITVKNLSKFFLIRVFNGTV